MRKIKKIVYLASCFLYGLFEILYLLILDKKTIYVITDMGIGDIFPTLAYLPEYRKKKKINHITVIGVIGKEDLYHMYRKCYNNIIYRKKENYIRLMKFTSTDVGYALILKSQRIVSTRLGTNSRGDYVQRLKSTSYIETIKYGVFDLDSDAKMVSPIIRDVDISNIINELKMIEGRTVILNPYANSIENVPIGIFEEIAAQLASKGYRVLTNVFGNDQIPVKGTQSLTCSLEEAFCIVQYCGNIIGTRSGYMDFLSRAKCRLIALFPREYPFYEYQMMKKWGMNDQILDIRVSDSKEDMEKIINFICGEKLNGK